MTPKIALINMPFASARRPSLALGLLKAIAQESGFEARVFNFNLAFAQQLGIPGYEMLCGAHDIEDYGVSMAELTGEWLFSQHFHGDGALAADEYIAYLTRAAPMPPTVERIVEQARGAVPSFIQSCLEATDWSQFDLIGFTSTFEQTMACLSLAREIRRRHPEVKIAFGGANCESGMGAVLLRNYEFIDLICTGEGDVAFPELLRQLRDGGSWWKVDGFHARRGEALHLNPPPPVTRDLDALPYPNLDEYFEELPMRGLTEVNAENGVLLETSRGCWWGAKSHCTFCGLNGRTMQFRAKSPDRAMAELRHFVERHGSRKIDFADNIVDMDYFDTFLERISALEDPPEIFYETKSNLRRRHLLRLADANVRFIQPGIESFDDDVLARMGKGVRGLQNVAVLKWAHGYGVHALWNLLYGFPGESPESYAWMPELFRRMEHLNPPTAVAPIRLDRFSPNFVRAKEKGIVNVRPMPAYAHVFDLSVEDLREIAYFFAFDYEVEIDPATYTEPLAEVHQQWRSRHARSPAFLHASPHHRGGIEVVDTRSCARAPQHVFDASAARIYCAFDEPHREERIRPLAAQLGYDDAGFDALLQQWDELGIVVRRNGTCVALATMEDDLLDRFATGELQAARAAIELPHQPVLA